MPIITTTDMFKKAYAGGYAVGAFNVNNMEIVQGITEAGKEENAPLILQVSAGARKYAKHAYLVKLVEAAMEDTGLSIALHLDHGADEENIALTKKVVAYAHDKGCVVEGELGQLAGVEDDVNVESHSYTDPSQVQEFVEKTGVDSLAIAIGTSHGAFKFKPGRKPQLRFDILDEVAKRLPGFPIVLHGASSVIPEFVETVNKYGGRMPDAIGIPEDMLRQAAKGAVCKINIDSDLRLAMTASVREHFALHPADFDPRQYLTPARTAIKEMVRRKIVNVLGCGGKA